MQRALLYFAGGTALSFLLNYLFVDSENPGLNFYYSLAYGFAWGLAHYLDTPNFSLPVKLGVSLLGMLLLIVAGVLIFTFEQAMGSVFKFSIIFVAYYLIASFRQSKSLRE